MATSSTWAAGTTGDRGWSQRVWIHDSIFARSGRQGIAVTAARDVVIEHNRFTDMRRATIDLEPNWPGWGADNIHVIDNQVGPGRLLFVAAGGSGPVDGVVIARNTLKGRALNVLGRPPRGQPAANGSGWSTTPPTPWPCDEPLQFTRTDGVVVRGNRQPIEAPDALVRSTDSCDVAVTDNAIAPSARALEGQSRRVQLQDAGGATGAAGSRGAGRRPPTTAADQRHHPADHPPTTAAPATSTTSSPTSAQPPADGQLAANSEGGDGVAGPVVVLAMVLSALAGVGALLAFSAWRARR